ncbi:dGTPase [Rheinheimera sp.]|uniref:dGTPase n=1 Tax=Rheinheimera sp. TaxID=1869214 RepID=UPI0027B954FD|nr:dGTPase [Rheinheimera sp.]
MSINFRSKILPVRPKQSQSKTQWQQQDYQLAHLQMQLESDRGRIINSAVVRRLQQKTQVFPLERNAAVRSRLTHSLEVQQVGRFIVQTIFRQLSETQQQQYQLTGLERACETLVEMACLMHDIGNPPFGHSGESAINRWFSQHLPLLNPLDVSKSTGLQQQWQQYRQELCNFEGNAQGLRLVVTLQQMNLTYSQSACILKYTRPAQLAKEQVPADFSYLMKKPGFYLSEARFVAEQNQLLGIKPHCRHPLTYIMEAADDISYCLADIEDAVEKGILSLEKLACLLKTEFARHPAAAKPIKGLKSSANFDQLIDTALQQAQQDRLNPTYEFFIRLRVSMIHPLVNHAAEQFIQHIDALYQGNFNRALLEDNSQYHAITQSFKKVAQQHVFNDREVEMLEIQGFKIISGLLDAMLPLLQLNATQFTAVISPEGARALPLESRLARKLPNKHLVSYQQALAQLDEQDSRYTLDEFYYRCRLLQDWISGMTDHFAFDEYRALVLCQ